MSKKKEVKEEAVVKVKPIKQEKVKQPGRDCGVTVGMLVPDQYLNPRMRAKYAEYLPNYSKACFKIKLVFIQKLLATLPLGLDALKYAMLDKAKDNNVDPSIISCDLECVRRTLYMYAGIVAREQNISMEEALVMVQEWGKTAFYRNADMEACVAAYQVKGMLKEVGKFLAAQSSTYISAIKGNYRSLINGDVTIVNNGNGSPYIPIYNCKGVPLKVWQDCVRPVIRTDVGQNEPSTAIACSECAPEGCYIDFTVVVNNKDELVTAVEEMFHYGIHQGLGAWRNAGNGKFVADIYEVNGKPADLVVEVAS